MGFLTGKINLKYYIDSSETEFPEEVLANIAKEFEDAAVLEFETISIDLAASDSQAISLNGVATVKRWYLYSSATELSLTINGTAGFTYQASMPGYMPIELSSLTIANASSTTATKVTLILITGT